jgi:alpha-D-ribose 1-methylphosphonate 5-triphosphate synthase subunit PhnL
MQPVLQLSDVSKTFTMHLQGGIELPVLRGLGLTVHREECVVIAGPSGAGKSSVLKMIFGSYRCDGGRILVRHAGETNDIAAASARLILSLRRDALGYVSQFLRAVPRVPAIDVVMEPLIAQGIGATEARERAGALLGRLNVPPRLWSLPPATFSGGEQQRINIARGFLPNYAILLLDEPTASLDANNRAAVIDLIQEKKRQGAAIVAIVHDDEVREAIADRVVDVARFSAATSFSESQVRI